MYSARTQPPRFHPELSYERETDVLNMLVAVGCLAATGVLYLVYLWVSATPPVAF